MQDFQKYFNKAFYPDSTFVNKDTITWIKKFNAAADSNLHKKQKTLLFVNTDWCNGGKTMLKSTFNNSSVTDYIKANFHTVYMNAMSHDTVKYNGKIYVNPPQNQDFHPFLNELMGEQVMLPIILFFDENMHYISILNQYVTPESLNPILHYFAEDSYRTQKWDEYIRTHQEKK